MKNWLARLGDFDTHLRRDSRKVYDFYQDGLGPEQKSRKGRYFSRGKAFFLSFLRKLTPARRISYLAGLGLFLLGFYDDSWLHATAGFLVLNFLLALELAEKLLTKNELEIARAIQFSLYPVGSPHLPHLEIASHFEPAHEVGGDYYDFSLEGTRRFTVILGDVSGKGIAAALYAMKLQALFELLGKSAPGPKRMLVEMNDVISERIERNYFITAVVGVVDFQERKLVLARAGHNHPLHFCARTGRATWLNPNGVGIGMKTNPGFEGLLEEMRVPLETGDVLVFYTDGIPEAMNPKSEPFGYGRLEGALAAASHLPAEGIKKELLKSLESFRQGEDFSDDVTLVVAKII
jgi:serine phosphatase RsbU (regulator of sigma subunit)